ncbi:hypothetical protein BUALT_Bualt07G0143100 [Buddleja alternifolia]|uniref:Ovate family protein n=1 Tax=Buddleja alternifolia TaxID=168488 RepID=A0AAV6XIV5_9LAMI|nr:hypothetical protein BUALT_Bualt07G0143100 [Buddleja alternifolia]
MRTEVKPQKIIKQTFYKTKKFFHKTLRNLKLFLLEGYQKLPKTPTSNPMFSSSLDHLYRNLPEQWECNEPPKEQTKRDEQCSNSTDCGVLEGVKQEKKARKCNERKQEEFSSGLLAANALAQKMKELEMMDVNDVDHVLDVEEVLHYYSRLTCPAYQEIVDKFFMDMHSGFNTPQPCTSVNSSMRKVGSASVHSSMRSLGPLKL